MLFVVAGAAVFVFDDVGNGIFRGKDGNIASFSGDWETRCPPLERLAAFPYLYFREKIHALYGDVDVIREPPKIVIYFYQRSISSRHLPVRIIQKWDGTYSQPPPVMITEFGSRWRR